MLLKRARAAHSLTELVVVFGIFSLLLMVAGVLFNESRSTLRRTSGIDTCMRELRKARAAVERDLVLARPGALSRSFVGDSLGGGGRDGEALWFLSPIDPATGEVVRKQDGTPFWQRNVLYYLVVPQNHNNTFGQICAGGAGANGYDDRCPHKVLIRKEIDSGPPTLPTDETTEETLLNNVAPYLTRPNGFDLTAMAEAGLGEKKIVASFLLGFESFSAPPPAGLPVEVLVDVRAMSIEEARKEIRVGSDPGYASRFTHQAPFSVYLRN
ncbi:hypothetical protein DYH09_17340 [bacterium CPR1]|nr:hypothetical protein [bacterium CPR1]